MDTTGDTGTDAAPITHERHASAVVCAVLNAAALCASIPVWVMARKAAVWSGGSENWDAFFLFLFGAGVLVVQVTIALVGLALLLCNIKSWTRREKWVCAVLLPLPSISSLLAFAHSSPFYG